MARTKQTARKNTGGRPPRLSVAAQMARRQRATSRYVRQSSTRASRGRSASMAPSLYGVQVGTSQYEHVPPVPDQHRRTRLRSIKRRVGRPSSSSSKKPASATAAVKEVVKEVVRFVHVPVVPNPPSVVSPTGFLLQAVTEAPGGDVASSVGLGSWAQVDEGDVENIALDLHPTTPLGRLTHQLARLLPADCPPLVASLFVVGGSVYLETSASTVQLGKSLLKSDISVVPSHHTMKLELGDIIFPILDKFPLKLVQMARFRLEMTIEGNDDKFFDVPADGTPVVMAEHGFQVQLVQDSRIVMDILTEGVEVLVGEEIVSSGPVELIYDDVFFPAYPDMSVSCRILDTSVPAAASPSGPSTVRYIRQAYSTFLSEEESNARYLEQHGLSKILKQLLADKPADPVSIMGDFVKNYVPPKVASPNVALPQVAPHPAPVAAKPCDEQTMQLITAHLDGRSVPAPMELQCIQEVLVGLDSLLLLRISCSPLGAALLGVGDALDACLRHEESHWRQVFARPAEFPHSNVDTACLSLSVFETPGQHYFCAENAAKDSGDLIFASLQAHVEPHATGRTVVEQQEFERRWKRFSYGLFEGFDWSNVVVAGGAVVRCATPSATDDQYPTSDFDLFIHSTDQEGALEKLSEIDQHLRRTVGHQVFVVRTNNAITFALDHPRRHVQVILRLYKNPEEIMLGFDVDVSAMCYDGTRLMVGYRAVRALNRMQTLIDITRRSYTYETRLFKYAKRGFAVKYPGLDRGLVDMASLSISKFHMVTGLARLLLLEWREQNPHAFSSAPQRIDNVGRIFEEMAPDYDYVLDKKFSGSDAAFHEQVRAFETENDLAVEEYDAVFLPWGPEFNAQLLESQLVAKYIALNGRNMKHGRRVCPCFFAWTLEGVIEDKWTYFNPNFGDHEEYVVGTLEFLAEEPGRQMVGSFYAHTVDDWEVDAYYPVCSDELENSIKWSHKQLKQLKSAIADLQENYWSIRGDEVVNQYIMVAKKVEGKSPSEVRALLLILWRLSLLPGRFNFGTAEDGAEEEPKLHFSTGAEIKYGVEKTTKAQVVEYLQMPLHERVESEARSAMQIYKAIKKYSCWDARRHQSAVSPSRKRRKGKQKQKETMFIDLT